MCIYFSKNHLLQFEISFSLITRLKFHDVQRTNTWIQEGCKSLPGDIGYFCLSWAEGASKLSLSSFFYHHHGRYKLFTSSSVVQIEGQVIFFKKEKIVKIDWHQIFLGFSDFHFFLQNLWAYFNNIWRIKYCQMFKLR